ncbi:hypothetical protein STEG23_005484, partial [Scotinomys teguina]
AEHDERGEVGSERKSTVYICITLIRSADGHLDWSHFLAPVNRAAMIMATLKFAVIIINYSNHMNHEPQDTFWNNIQVESDPVPKIMNSLSSLRTMDAEVQCSTQELSFIPDKGEDL